MDENVKLILADVYREISERLESSKRISRSVRQLEELGYKMAMYMEATILLSRDDDDTEPAAKPTRKGAKKRSSTRTRRRVGDLTLSDGDLAFLKSLKISLGRDKDS